MVSASWMRCSMACGGWLLASPVRMGVSDGVCASGGPEDVGDGAACRFQTRLAEVLRFVPESDVEPI